MTVPGAVRVQVVKDAAWVVGQAVGELREAYFAVAAALDQLALVTAGSRHPLPARSRRCWRDALGLANRAERAINTGIGHLKQVPGVRSLGTAGDVVAALTDARTGVDRTAATVGQLRDQVERARMHLVEGDDWTPAIERAVGQWRTAGEQLDLMVARLHVGVAALATYPEGVSGGDPRPGRQTRLAGLLPHTRGPADAILAGARAAGRLVAAGWDYPRAPALPAAGPIPLVRWLWAAARRGPRRPPATPSGATPRGGVDGEICAWVLSRLCVGDLRRYERWLHRFAERDTVPGYAGYLAAAFLLAVARRFRPGQDQASITRCVATARDRYDPDGVELDPAVAEWLIRAALGEPEHGRPPPATGAAPLVTAQTVLLISLLVDEGLSRDELDDFLAEAGRTLAGSGTD